MGCLEWVEERWFRSAKDVKCIQIDVNEAGDETVMAPPFHQGPRLSKTGKILPSIGLGVYKSKQGEETYEAVLNALRGGYRLIDTAQSYGNEADVGRAVGDSGIPREEIFITSKLSLNNWGYETARDAIKASIRKLNVACIDLFLLHAPGDPALRAETWRCLEDAQQEGILGDIGVSNFSERHLEKLQQTAKVCPAVNQIEVHPWLQRRELVRYCQERNIIVEAYSPLAKASKLSDPVVGSISHRMGVTPAQVLVAWSLSKGLVTLPKSINPERQRQNLEASKINLDASDIQELDGLEEGLVTGWDPIKDAPV